MPNADTTPRTPGLEERLKEAVRGSNLDVVELSVVYEAADEIARLTAERDELRKACELALDLRGLLAESFTAGYADSPAGRSADQEAEAIEAIIRRALNPEGADHA